MTPHDLVADKQLKWVTHSPASRPRQCLSSVRVLGHEMPVACIEDLVQGKLRAATDAGRRASKRQKDRLDLPRLCEAHPQVLDLIPRGLVQEVDSMRGPGL